MVFAIPKYEMSRFRSIEKSAKFFNEEALLKKVDLKELSSSGIIAKAAHRAKNIFGSRFFWRFAHPELVELVKNTKVDVIWIGDNVVDDSNTMFVVVKKTIANLLPIIRSYKETNFKKKWDEFFTIKNADYLIVPHSGYRDFFNRLYGIDLKNTAFADLDWRYSKLIDYVMKLKVQKLSQNDHTAHVCILTNVAHCDGKIRNNFLPLIKELIHRDMKVHLHAYRIIPSRKYGNLYEQLAKKSNRFYIEPPIDLSGNPQNYQILKRYDAGILHLNILDSIDPLAQFQQINIPNKLYEYQMAGVVPILESNSLPAAEKIIHETQFGIVYNNYDELRDRLYDLIKGNMNNALSRDKIKDYRSFASVFLNCFENLVRR